MPPRTAVVLAACLLAAGAASAQAPQPPASRGALLYGNHCIACHSTQMHWREQRLATDWDSLRGQVRRWQSIAGLGWSDADVDDVARHLNETIYRFEPPTRTSQLVRPGGRAQ